MVDTEPDSLNIRVEQFVEMILPGTVAVVVVHAAGRAADKDLLLIQPGDVPETAADISAIQRYTGFAPTTASMQGVPKFVAWYRDYHGL